jgi:hypothetical protein
LGGWAARGPVATTTGDCGGDRVSTVEVLDLSFSGVFAHPASFVLGNLLKKLQILDLTTTRARARSVREIAYALIEPWTPPRYAVRVLESPKFLHSYRKLEVLNLFTFLEH